MIEQEQSLLTNQKKYFLGKESLKTLDKAFARLQIPCVLIKGFSLSEKYWDRPIDRPIGDIDLCCAPEDFKRAGQLLLSLGATEEEHSSWEGNQFKRVFYFQGMPIEIHQYLLYGERKVHQKDWEPSNVFECQWIQELSPEHNLIYLAGHAGHQHFYEQWFWLEDIYNLLKKEKLDVKKVALLAKEIQLEKVLYLSLKLVGQKYSALSFVDSYLKLRNYTFIDFFVFPIAKNESLRSKRIYKQWCRFWLRDVLRESIGYVWFKLKLPFKL